MTNYIGLDAHSKTCTGVVFDSRGNLKQKSHFATSEKNLLTFINSVPRPRKLAFEELGIAQWLFLLLKDHVDDLTIAHAPHLTQQRGAKTDLIDAVRLATELRLKTLTPVFHSDSHIYELRALLANHKDLTKDLVRAKNRYKAFLRSIGRFEFKTSIYDKIEIVNGIEQTNHKFIAESLFKQIAALDELKKQTEKELITQSKRIPVIAKLRKIPGISYIRASTIAGTVVDGARFTDKHKFWSYSGLVRHCKMSDGKSYGSRKAHGSRELKCVFMGAAISTLAGTSSLRKSYDRLRSKGLSDRHAKTAVARKIAAIALMTMKTGVSYDERHELKKEQQSKNLN